MVIITRKALSQDTKVLANLLARTFYDDPISEFLFPSDKRRLRALERFFNIEIGLMYLPLDEVWTTQDLDGVAVWAPPGRHRRRVRDLVKLTTMIPFVIGHPIRNFKVLSALEAKHPREPHYYLATLGTDPSRQGKGVGTQLLKSVLSSCDEQGIPAYLESSKERNVPLYARNGFEVTEVLELPGGGPKVWLMWREPRPPEY